MSETAIDCSYSIEGSGPAIYLKKRQLDYSYVYTKSTLQQKNK